MSLFAAYTIPDAEPADGPDVATGRGWLSWGSWVLSRAREFPEAAHFAQEGWAEGDLPGLEADLERLLHEQPPGDLGAVTAQVLAAVRQRPPAAVGVIVTDGEPGGGDDEDRPVPAQLSDGRAGDPPAGVHPDEAEFRKKMADDPEDDTARLAYADWLAEHGRGTEAGRLNWHVRTREGARSAVRWGERVGAGDVNRAVYELDNKPKWQRHLFGVHLGRAVLGRHPLAEEYAPASAAVHAALNAAERHALGLAGDRELYDARRRLADEHEALHDADAGHTSSGSAALQAIRATAHLLHREEDGEFIPDLPLAVHDYHLAANSGAAAGRGPAGSQPVPRDTAWSATHSLAKHYLRQGDPVEMSRTPPAPERPDAPRPG